MAEKPGVMLYFELMEPIEDLSCRDKGRLLEAILNYGRYGELPEFRGALKAVWSFVRPMLDRDSERYEKRVLRNRYSAFCGHFKKKNPMAKVPDFEEWLAGLEQPPADADERMPTTNATPETKTNTISISITNPDAVTDAATNAATNPDAATTPDAPAETDFEAIRRARIASLLAME